ncbi:hypothetical protein ABZ931_41755, partial [Streptomyces neyagawaensis]
YLGDPHLTAAAFTERDAVAERDGAMLHLTTTGRTPRERGHRPGDEQATEATETTEATDTTEAAETATAYARAFDTLAQHVPVVTVHVGEASRLTRATEPHRPQLWGDEEQLTIGWRHHAM